MAGVSRLSFDDHALHVTLSTMHYLRKCPLRCGGYLQNNCLCTSADCVAMQLKKQALLQAHISLGTWASSAGAKCCPTCYSPIEKNMGCDHMYCISCKTRFNWSQAPQFGTGDHWYRPEDVPAEARKLVQHFKALQQELVRNV